MSDLPTDPQWIQEADNTLSALRRCKDAARHLYFYLADLAYKIHSKKLWRKEARTLGEWCQLDHTFEKSLFHRLVLLGNLRSRITEEDKQKIQELNDHQWREIKKLVQYDNDGNPTNTDEIVSLVHNIQSLTPDHLAQTVKEHNGEWLPLNLGDPAFIEGMEGPLANIRRCSLSRDKESYHVLIRMDKSVFSKPTIKVILNTNAK